MQVTTHGQGDTSLVEKELRSRMLYSRLLGALFLAGFLFYGSGSLLVDSITGEPDFVSTIPEQETLLVLGAFLMLVNIGVDVGKGVLFFPILEGHGKRTALAYLAAVIVQVVFLGIGALFLLMLVPLGELAVEGGGASPEFVTGLGSLLTESNTISYNIGQAVLSFGGLFLCWLLFRTGLIPRALAALGVVGYVLHAVGPGDETRHERRPYGIDSVNDQVRDVGAGVHTGTSFVGSVGEGDARDFTALGDTVNTAARLTGLAGAGEILISTEAATAGGLETTGLEQRTLQLRGRERSVDAWVASAPT